MNVKIEDTYTATIWVGLKVGYSATVYSVDSVKALCQAYVDKVGLCVTVTETEYMYTNGNEKGVAIGLINYPRFPDTRANILEKAIELGRLLMESLQQYKVTIVTPNKTYMLENEEMEGVE